MKSSTARPVLEALIPDKEWYSFWSCSSFTQLRPVSWSMAYDIYSLGVAKGWPCRLLHIPSMTSMERKAGNIYGQDKEPSYSILSYTWGRYEVAEGPRLEVSGIDWRIPSIKEECFTVADLQHLLYQISLLDAYVWIDIACIDQKREKAKMEEVGRQASIFKVARHAYVWLHRYEPRVIQQHMQKLMQCTFDFAHGNTSALQAAIAMEDSVYKVLQDFWFSSLWTLQESVLQRHALLLNKRGEPIICHGPWTGESPNVQLLDVSGACGIAKLAIDQATLAEGSTSPHIARLQSLRSVIDKSGVDFMLCGNPNIHYAAARFRQTTHLEDRIYAIMQVYGYKLGNSVTSIRKMQRFDLQDLELQFLKTLTSQSAVLSQAFQHLRAPSAGQSWCITNHICVPKRFHDMIVHDQFLAPACGISVRRKDEAYFEGSAWTLCEVFSFFKSRTQEMLTRLEDAKDAPTELVDRNAYFRKGSARDYLFKEAKQGTIMDYSNDDDSAELSFEWPPDTEILDDNREAPIIECRIPELTRAAEKLEVVGEAIITKYSDMEPSVLYLGRSKTIESMEVALIIVRNGSIRRGLRMTKKGVWRRVGLCFWHVEGGPVDELAKLMRPMKGRFG